MKVFFQFILRPWFLALLFTLLLIFAIPLGRKKYSYSILGRDNLPNRFTYEDLDKDGFPEKINSSENYASSYIYVENQNQSTIDQWNFEGKFPDFLEHISFQDINGDGKKEIFTFYLRNDSLFLLGINAYYDREFLFKDLFIEKVHHAFGKAILNIIKTEWHDSNDDGVPELYFVLFGGFAIEPRNIYCLNLLSKTLIKSPLRYTNISDFFFSDMNQDGKDEVILSTSASANVHNDTLPYNDQYTWLIVLNQDLQFLFPPKKIFPFISNCNNFPIAHKSGKSFLSYQTFTYDSVFQSKICIYSGTGLLIDSSVHNYVLRSQLPSSFYIHENNIIHPYLIDASGTIFAITSDLSLKKIASLGIPVFFINKIDLDGDKPMFLFTEGVLPNLLFTDHNFKICFRVPLNDFHTEGPLEVKTLSHKKGKTVLYLSKADGGITLEFHRNSWFYLQILVWMASYGFLWILFKYFKQVWEKQVNEKNSIERNLIQLQLSSLSSQLDPHLTFNLLNSISYVLLKHEGKELHDSFTQLTTYIRKTLVQSDQLIVPLSDEIEFVESYLSLQQTRLKERLSWSLSRDPDLPQNLYIPRMALQNLVENSIKHGLKQKQEGGKVEIQLVKNAERLLIRVIDNGIGKAALKTNGDQSTGKGLRLIRQFFELLNKFNTEKAYLNLTFPEEPDGICQGAIAEISIPLTYKYQ
jgi:hypothetical protein